MPRNSSTNSADFYTPRQSSTNSADYSYARGHARGHNSYQQYLRSKLHALNVSAKTRSNLLNAQKKKHQNPPLYDFYPDIPNFHERNPSLKKKKKSKGGTRRRKHTRRKTKHSSRKRL